MMRHPGHGRRRPVASASNHAMMHAMTRRFALLALLALPVPAGADPAPVAVQLTFDGYASGFRVLSMQTEMLLAPTGYRIAIAGRTAGMVGLLYHANWQTWADGTWTASGISPQHFDNAGVFGGQPRHVALVFEHGEPVIRTLDPPDDTEHLPVTADAIRHAVDSLSITALVIHQIATQGHCAGETVAFDGRQAEALTLHAAGGEDLPATTRSSWRGPTLRCDIDARVIAGFFREGDTEASRNYVDTLWMGNVLPGVPPLPVRMTATTHHLGRVMLYLTKATLRDAGTLTARTP